MARELSEEEIMANDVDPMDAIREIRAAQGVPEDELPDRSEQPISDSSDVRTELEAQEQLEKDNAEEQEQDNTEEEEEKELPGKVDDASKKAESQDSEDSDDETDSDQSSTDENDSEEKADSEENKGPVKRTFPANGKEFEFTQDEIMDQFETVFGQAMNYTQKMQAIAPYRKMISALEQEGISHDQLNVAIDALKGDKGALKKLMEDNKIDAYDLSNSDDEQSPYTPKDYGKSEFQLDIEEITSKIQGDKEFAITTNVIDEQWDSSSRQTIAQNPSMILGLHNDIKTGVYDKVAPVAMKMKVLDGNTKSDIEYYMLAGQQMAQQLAAENKQAEGQRSVTELNQQAQDADSKFEEASSKARRKRSATSTGARADRKGVIDYLDDDDEAFEEWYKNLQSSI